MNKIIQKYQKTESTIIYHLALLDTHTDLILDRAEPKYFQDDGYRKIFNIASNLRKRGKLTPPTLSDEVIDKGLSTKLVKAYKENHYLFREFLEDEMEKALDYMREKYIKNNIKSKIAEISTEEMANLLAENRRGKGLEVSKETLDGVIKEMVARDTEKIPFPSSMLNNILGGARKGEYTVIAARPSVGKTAFMEQMFWENTDFGKKALFISIEMGESALLKRQIQRTTGVNLFEEIVEPERKIELLEDVKHQMNKSKFYVGAYTVNDIEKIVEKESPDVVFVDYLQRVTASSRRLSDYEKVTQITEDLAALRTKYPIALIVASQYKRGVNEQPKLSDLRSSGQIEQDADLVLSLWKRKGGSVEDFRKVYIDCLKNRNGKKFGNSEGYEFSLAFIPERVKFMDVDDMYTDKEVVYGHKVNKDNE